MSFDVILLSDGEQYSSSFKSSHTTEEEYEKIERSDIRLRNLSKELLRISRNALTYHEEIGHGAFSKAYRATMTNSDRYGLSRSQEVAVKMIDTSHPLYDAKKTLNEMVLCQLLGKLSNVCTFHGCGGGFAVNDYDDDNDNDNNNNAASPFVVTKYYQKGGLRSWLDTNATPSIEKKQQITKDALRGVVQLHRANVVHRDIAARNCLMDIDGSVHVTDFGLSVLTDPAALDGTKLHTAEREWLPLKYMAPESLRSNESMSSHSTDVFMTGYLMWEIWTSKKPWSGVSAHEAMRLVLEGKREKIPAEVPNQVVKMIERCWHENPLERPNLEHELNRLK